MEILKTPRIWNKIAVTRGEEVAGYIQLVDYIRGAIPHVELELYPKYRGKGIMSEALPKYLQQCYENKVASRFIAVCLAKNIAAHKLIEKCGFVKTPSPKGKVIYLRDLEHSVKDLQKFMKSYKAKTL